MRLYNEGEETPSYTSTGQTVSVDLSPILRWRSYLPNYPTTSLITEVYNYSIARPRSILEHIKKTLVLRTLGTCFLVQGSVTVHRPGNLLNDQFLWAVTFSPTYSGDALVASLAWKASICFLNCQRASSGSQLASLSGRPFHRIKYSRFDARYFFRMTRSAMLKSTSRS